MRLFVAVDVDGATRDAAARLRARVEREHPQIQRAVRWVDPKQLHMTLKFLGEHGDATDVCRALAPPWSQPHFSVAWGTPGWLPPRGRPRVLFVPVTEGLDAMRALAAEVALRFVRLGLPPDPRPFNAHLTLGRVRDRADPVVVHRLSTSFDRRPFAPGLRVEIGGPVLYESHLSPAGPSYDVLWQGQLP